MGSSNGERQDFRWGGKRGGKIFRRGVVALLASPWLRPCIVDFADIADIFDIVNIADIFDIADMYYLVKMARADFFEAQ